MSVAGLPEDWFTAYYEAYFELKVDPGTGGQTSLTCGSANKCKIRPNWHQTPISTGLSPNVLYPGLKTVLMVNPMGVPDRKFKGTFLHKIDIKLDDTELNMTPFTDEEVSEEENLNSWRTNYVEGYVVNELANEDPVLTAWFHGAGNAYENKDRTRVCPVKGGECYTNKILPTVRDVSTSGGYTTGGQELVIEGTSLNSGAATVTVDGVECSITSQNFTAIVCTTGEKSLGVQEENVVGQHGQRREHWDG